MNRQRDQGDNQDGEELGQHDDDQNQERGPRQETQRHNGRRQLVLNFHEFTPEQQHAWLRARFSWLFAVAEHFEPMTDTTVEIAIRMLCDYMYSNHLHEMPMDHVMRCSAAACLRLAILLNESDYMTLQELIRIGENRFTPDEIFESEFHIYRSLGGRILSPRTVESCARSYLVLMETDGNASIANLWEPLGRLISLAIRDLLFLQHPAQSIGLAVIVVALQLSQRDDSSEGSLTMRLYRPLGIEEDSREAAMIVEIGSRLSTLHHHSQLEED